MARTHQLLVAAFSCSLLIWATNVGEAQFGPKRTTPPRTQSRTGSAQRGNIAPRTSGSPRTTPRTAPRQGAGQPERPNPQAYRVKKLAPEMEQVLLDWETESAKVRELNGGFKRWTYDSTFFVEKRAEGKFIYKTPDEGLYQVRGGDVPSGTVSRRKSPKGVPYTVVEDDAERWICTGKEIYQINDGERTYDRIAIPPENQGQNMMDGPLPFLFGMKAEQAKRRYELELLKKTTTEIWISAVPLWQHDRANYKKATIILDRKTFLPKAVQTIDPAGTKETVHTFENVEANPRAPLLPRADPLRPKLTGYKPVIHPETVQRSVDESNNTTRRSRSDFPK